MKTGLLILAFLILAAASFVIAESFSIGTSSTIVSVPGKLTISTSTNQWVPGDYVTGGKIAVNVNSTNYNLLTDSASPANWNPSGTTNSTLAGIASMNKLVVTNTANVTGDITGSNINAAGGAGVTLRSNGDIKFSSAGYIIGPSSGVLEFLDSATTSFNRFQLGGTTASFPALQRSTTNLVARLADDSADTGIRAAYILFGTNILSFSGTGLTWNGQTVTVP